MLDWRHLAAVVVAFVVLALVFYAMFADSGAKAKACEDGLLRYCGQCVRVIDLGERR